MDSHRLRKIDEKIKDLRFAIYGSQEYEYKGGVYNMLGGFTAGIHKAFQKRGLNSEYIDVFLAQQLIPHISIGFNASCLDIWKPILESGGASIMWSVDSLFYNNLPLIKDYSKYPNFFCFSLSRDDDAALKNFFPALNTFYLPLAIDKDIWMAENPEKTRDIVFLASIQDVEENLENLKSRLQKNPQTFDLYYEMFKYSLRNPQKNFWEVYTDFNLTKNDVNFYGALLKELTYLVSYQRRIDMIKYLSKTDLNVEIWGNGPWEKYTGNNVKHMGTANLFEAIEIVKSAKIALNLQPMQILGGIHDRIINSAAANTFVFTDKTIEISRAFDNKIGYIQLPDFAGLAHSLKDCLKNDSKRKDKTKAAQRIVLNNHTWDARVEKVLKNIIAP